jgi:SPP1 family predicted phage head-tail adaptor
LRERVDIQAVSETKDAMGSPVQAWSTVAQVWADVAPMSTSEQWRRQQMQSAAGFKVTVRYRADLTPQHRIVLRNRVFQVRGMTNPDQRKRFLEIACDEINTTVLQ